MLLLLICYESHNPKNIVIMATIKAINGIDSNTSNPITIMSPTKRRDINPIVYHLMYISTLLTSFRKTPQY